MTPILELNKIDKRFGNVHALKEISLTIEKGDVFALAGENGAGKSTLMKILTGAYRKDSGDIFVDGRKVEITCAADARKLGIAQVYQQAELLTELSVAENIFLGDGKIFKKGLVSWKTVYSKADALLKKYKIPLDSRTKVKDLNIAMRQLVAVAKVLQQQPEIVIFDEPTAVLSDNEVGILFDIVAQLKNEKTTIIYISHRLEELFQLSNKIAVMRDGALVVILPNQKLTKEDLITQMLGRKMEAMYPEKNLIEVGQPVLELRNITTAKVQDISFQLKKGEILGITGLVGSGRTELVKAIYGLDKVKSGQILIYDKETRIRSAREATRRGIFLAPEDRKGEALVLIRSIRENITLSNLKKISRYGFCGKKKEFEATEKLKDELHIKTESMETLVKNLSGGNQQKVVIAKAITAEPEILIFDEPTQGIDVGAKSEIYTLLNNLQKTGVSILLISSEIEEVQGLCNRILVMRGGQLVGEVNENLEDTEYILNLMYRSKKS